MYRSCRKKPDTSYNTGATGYYVLVKYHATDMMISLSWVLTTSMYIIWNKIYIINQHITCMCIVHALCLIKSTYVQYNSFQFLPFFLSFFLSLLLPLSFNLLFPLCFSHSLPVQFLSHSSFSQNSAVLTISGKIVCFSPFLAN